MDSSDQSGARELTRISKDTSDQVRPATEVPHDSTFDKSDNYSPYLPATKDQESDLILARTEEGHTGPTKQQYYSFSCFNQTHRVSRRLVIGMGVFSFLSLFLLFLLLLKYPLNGAATPLLDSTTTMTWNSLSNYPDSVCNDGSVGGYYYTPSMQNISHASYWKNVWVINLPGGGQCYDQASCQSRWGNGQNSLMTSKVAPSSISPSGILSSSEGMNPILYGANKASLYYCSSDGYMGNLAASNATWGFHFRGQKLIRAMLKDLRKKYDLSSATLIVFAGESAGGRGVMTNIDSLVYSSEQYFPPPPRWLHGSIPPST